MEQIYHERARQAVEDAKLTYNVLAKRLRVTKQTAWSWINKELPPLERFYQICDVLNVSADWMLGREARNATL